MAKKNKSKAKGVTFGFTPAVTAEKKPEVKAVATSGEKPLKVLFVSSEVYPFARTGGLGDVVGSLPMALKKMGHDVRLVMPRYYMVNREKWNLKPIGEPLGVPMGFGEQWCAMLEGRLPKSEVPIYFLEHEGYFGRAQLYGEAGGDYPDNAERFTFLSRGALQLCKAIGFYPDVIHCNDWQTALIPIYLNSLEWKSELGRAATLLTIHNVGYQGVFPKENLFHTQLGWEHFNYLELEQHDALNFLKGGIYHTTMINAVSPKYAVEIQTPEGGYGLDGALWDRREVLRGVLNGVDYDEWNPATDKCLPAHFSAADLSGKAECKAALQKTFNLEPRPGTPIFGIVGRLAWQKGLDLVADTLDDLMRMDLQFVLLGSGDPELAARFEALALKYPGRVGIKIGYDNTLSHLIEAGSDFFLMPSRYEPCGLNQFYSLRYGTLPLVRATGGLDDTVENCNEGTGEGDGFKFYDLTKGALHDTVGWALYVYYNRKDLLTKMIARAMSRDYSWETSAAKYGQLYAEAIRLRRAGE